MRTALVFGASGAIGRAICIHLKDQGAFVIGAGRSNGADYADFCSAWAKLDGDFAQFSQALKQRPEGRNLNCIVWAQGMNFSDDIHSFDVSKHLQMYEANVIFILQTLESLLLAQLLSKDARLCVISSIWQNIARQKKLSYCVTKSALQGLVQSLSIDLGKHGILINAVLPGALDTPMTKANLQADQIEKLESATPLGSLPTLNDVTSLVDYLCSPSNTGITGQFIAADRGFSHARIL